MSDSKPSKNNNANETEYFITVNVVLQGFSSDLVTANGSYVAIELSDINLSDLISLLEKLKQAKPIANSNQDDCPPSLIINKGSESFSFEISGGSLLYSSSNAVVSTRDAIDIINGITPPQIIKSKTEDAEGNIHHSSSVWGSGHHDVKGLQPIRKKDIPPTDRSKTESATVNYKNSSSINEMVLKSSVSGNQHIGLVIFGILALILGFGGFAIEELGLGIISSLVAFILFVLSGVVKKKARGNLSLGFDWSTNTIWVIFPGKKLSFLGNANCIIKLSIQQDSYTRTRYGNIGSSEFRINTRTNIKNKIYIIMVEKTDNSIIPLCTLFNEKDAVKVLNKASALLEQQND